MIEIGSTRRLLSLGRGHRQARNIRLDRLYERERGRVTSCSACARAIETGEPFAAASAASVRRPPKPRTDHSRTDSRRASQRGSRRRIPPLRDALRASVAAPSFGRTRSHPRSTYCDGRDRGCGRRLHKRHPGRRAESRIGSLRTKPTWITFTSGSTVKNWLALPARESLEGVRIASIGPATSEVIRKHGLRHRCGSRSIHSGRTCRRNYQM